MNVFELAMTKEDGTIDFTKAFDMAPDYMTRNVQTIIPWAINMLCQTKLSDEFIRTNFEYLHFGTLVVNNEVPQDVIEANMEGVFSKFIFGLGSEEFDEKVVYFFQANYDAHVYEKLIEMCFTYFASDEMGAIDEDDIESFVNLLNAFPEIVSKEFILKHAHDAGYLLFTAALKRGDFTIEELFTNLDLIDFEELWAWHEQFDENELDEEGEGIFTLDNRNTLYMLLSTKASDKIIE